MGVVLHLTVQWVWLTCWSTPSLTATHVVFMHIPTTPLSVVVWWWKWSLSLPCCFSLTTQRLNNLWHLPFLRQCMWRHMGVSVNVCVSVYARACVYMCPSVCVSVCCSLQTSACSNCPLLTSWSASCLRPSTQPGTPCPLWTGE